MLPLLLKALKRGGIAGLDLLRREPLFQIVANLVGPHYLTKHDNIIRRALGNLKISQYKGVGQDINTALRRGISPFL